MCKPKSWLSNLFARESQAPPASTKDELFSRIARAVESILENEGLTADLDDAAAKVLLDWGADSAKLVVQSTSGLAADVAEEAMAPRLRANRRMLRLVNRWEPKHSHASIDDNALSLAGLVEQATIIYAEDFTPPTAEWQAAFLKESVALSGVQFVIRVRELIENQAVLTNLGGTDDQEKHDQETGQEAHIDKIDQEEHHQEQLE